MFTLVSGKEVIPKELYVKQNKYIQKCKQDFIFEQRSEEKVSLSDDKNVPPRQFK
uniref:Uncharacterized protein n=1 Tax=Rhodnius prolixus TaxID=13249 RepID=T1I0T6_RHOPR